jgi:hypothetical protein
MPSVPIDGVEFHRCTAGLANAFFHLGREAPQVEVAGHGFDPGIGHADQRTAEIGIGVSNRFEHRASASAIASFGNSTTDVFEIHS